jgi:hypothetical protein
MAKPANPPAPRLSDQAIEAILALGGASDNSADLHVHEDVSHICITVVGTPNLEGLQGFVMFCDVPM